MNRKGIIGSFLTGAPAFILVMFLSLILVIAGAYLSAGRDVGLVNMRSFYDSSAQEALFTTFELEGNVYSVVEFGVQTLESEHALRVGTSDQRDLFSFIDSGRETLASQLLATVSAEEKHCFIFYQTDTLSHTPLACKDSFEGFGSPLAFGSSAESLYSNTMRLPDSHYFIFDNGTTRYGKCEELMKYYIDGHLSHSYVSIEGWNQPLQFFAYSGRCLYDE